MATTQLTLLIYGLLMIAGGVMGQRAGSKVSLGMGVASGLVLLVGWYVGGTTGLWIGIVVSLLLSIVFGMRLAKTKKVMPAGMLLAVSVVVLLILGSSAL